MKTTKWLIGVLMLSSLLPLFAVENPTSCAEDDFWHKYKDSLPETYCECTYNTTPFVSPVDTVLTEPVWFSATMDDIRQGISAYWFSDDSVALDIYAFCISHGPAFSMIVPPNRMYEMPIEEINRRIDALPGSAGFLTALEPRIHAYTLHGGTGQVYCYPYNHGPHSTCDKALEMRSGMTYICEEMENVYRLPWKNMPSNGAAFLRWVQKPNNVNKKSKPADIRLTLDSCNGEEVGRTTLIDSMHVYVFDSAMLVDARQAKRDMWVHVSHEEGAVGRLRYYARPKYGESLPDINQSTCLGKTITVNGREYASDTTFVDGLYVNRDTLSTQHVTLVFTEPTPIYDTVYVDPKDLKHGVVHVLTEAVLFNYGDTIIDVVAPKKCTKRYQVTVKDPTPIENVDAEQKGARKQIQNGRIIIFVDERKYNIVGQQID
jgi:hypothetical protein